MTLTELISNWQELLDRHPTRSKGWLEKRLALFGEYRSPDGVYIVQCPREANNFHPTDLPNGSPLRETTVSELLKYACDRLISANYDFANCWDCEMFLDDEDGTFVASSYNLLGGRVTVHGIHMTKNWSGVISDRGVIFQC